MTAFWHHRFIQALGLACALSWSATAQETPPADVSGWGNARWGMSEAELMTAFGSRLELLPGRWEYGNAYATRTIPDAKIGNLGFRAFFQMNADTNRLQQVLLERRREDSDRFGFQETKTTLEAAYGPAHLFCLRDRPPGAPRIAELSWRFPTTTVRATFFDFQSFGILTQNTRLPVDTYLTDRERRRVHRRTLPKKLLVRFHPSERQDLEPAGECRPMPAEQ